MHSSIQQKLTKCSQGALITKYKVLGAEQVGRSCEKSLALTIFVPVPYCLQGKGRMELMGQWESISRLGGWRVAIGPDIVLESVGSTPWGSVML